MPNKNDSTICGFVISEKDNAILTDLGNKVFLGIKTRPLNYIKEYPLNGKKGCAIRFEIDNAIFFPALMDNYREMKDQMKLSMQVYVRGCKVNLDLLK